MSITLTPETENRLREQAERIGEDVDSLAKAIINEGLSYDLLADDPDDLTDEQMAESRAGIKRGLEAAAGRVKTLAQVVVEARQRHGFPSSWASGVGVTLPYSETPMEQKHEAS